MSRCSFFVIVAVFLGSNHATAAPAPRPTPPDFRKLDPKSLAKWAGAEVLVIGKLTNVTAGC